MAIGGNKHLLTQFGQTISSILMMIYFILQTHYIHFINEFWQGLRQQPGYFPHPSHNNDDSWMLSLLVFQHNSRYLLNQRWIPNWYLQVLEMTASHCSKTGFCRIQWGCDLLDVNSLTFWPNSWLLELIVWLTT